MADQVIDYRRIAVKGITALEQIGRFTIRVFVQVRQPPLPPSYMSDYSTVFSKCIVDIWHKEECCLCGG
jgi:hypothetical protein